MTRIPDNVSLDLETPRWRRLMASVLSAWLLLSPTGLVFAGPVADATAAASVRPSVTTLGSVPLVNITAPNAAGMSYNRYQSFNVDPVGVLLNNSKTALTNSLGVSTAANPNFTGRSASIILNEVVTALPSQLNGPLGVLGDSAQVIIANPNGITCNGCSFLNTSGVQLTTGSIGFRDSSGAASSFDAASAISLQVAGGQILIAGDGLSSPLARLDLVAETLKIDGPLSISGTLNLLAGRQTIDADTLAVLTSGSGNNRAGIGGIDGTWSIDATALGALNAGSIRIVSTPAGLGVRAAQLAASGGDLTISSNGDLTLTSAVATGNATLTAAGKVNNLDQIVAGKHLQLAAAGNLNNLGGLIAALGDADISAAALDNSGGQIQASNHLSLTLPGGTLDLAATTTGTLAAGGDMTIHADTVNNSGTFGHSGNLTLTADGTLDNSGTLASGKNLNLYASSLHNSGTLYATQNLLVSADSVSNSGEAYAAALLDLTARNSFTNSGTFMAGTDATVSLGNTVNNTGGTLSAGHDLTLDITASGGLGGTVAATNDLYLNFTDYTNGAGETTFSMGRDLTVTANTLANAGALAAYRNLKVTTTGNLDNSGQLLAGQDIALNVGATFTNTAGAVEAYQDLVIAAVSVVNQRGPLTSIYTNWGDHEPAGAVNCRSDHGYCESWEDVESTPAGSLAAGRDLTARVSGVFVNEASLLTAGRDITIDANEFRNLAHTLNTQWHGHWGEWHGGLFSGYDWHDDHGTTVTGSTPSIIQAGSSITIHAATQTNTGNITANDIYLGGNLTNGLTDYHQQTPASTTPQNVIDLAANPGSLPGATFNAKGTTLFASAAQLALLAPIGQSYLLSLLPESLRNSTTPFLMDAWLEQQALRQAALRETGQATFLAGLSYDAESGLSIDSQQRILLYQAAAKFATANGIALGVALTAEQQAKLSEPILWYVEQSVTGPDGKSYTALVPKVYLPQGQLSDWANVSGGLIRGNDVTIDAGEGKVRNTGFIVASNTLDLRAGELINEKRSADINNGAGAIKQYVGTIGYTAITGDTVQAGGFISAANLNLDVGKLKSVSGEFYENGVDKSAALKTALGSNASFTANQDHIHQKWVQMKKDNGLTQVFAMAVAVVISFYVGPLISGWVGSASGAGAGSFMGAAGTITVDGVATSVGAGVGNLMVGGALTAMTSSAATQLITTGKIDAGQMFKSGLAAGLTAGLTSAHLFNGQSLNEMAGLKDLPGTGTSLANGNFSDIGKNLIGITGRGLVSASVNSAIYHTSFGNAFQQSVITDLAAVGAATIGTKWGSGGNPFMQTVAHAGLGAVTAKLRGQDAVAGAIGGATESLLDNAVGDSLPKTDTAKALYAAAATMAGGIVSSALGYDPVTAATTAQNAALNNKLLTAKQTNAIKALSKRLYGDNDQVQEQMLAVACNEQDCAVNGMKGLADGDAAQLKREGETLARNNTMLYLQLKAQLYSNSLIDYGFWDRRADEVGVIRSAFSQAASRPSSTSAYKPAVSDGTTDVRDGLIGGAKAVGSLGAGDIIAAVCPTCKVSDFPEGSIANDSYASVRDVTTPTNATQAGWKMVVGVGLTVAMLVAGVRGNPAGVTEVPVLAVETTGATRAGTEAEVAALATNESLASSFLKNPSGDQNTAFYNAARTQPYGYGSSASPSPGTNTAGSTGASVTMPSVTVTETSSTTGVGSIAAGESVGAKGEAAIVQNFAEGTEPNLVVNLNQQNKHIVGTNEYKTASQITQRSPLASDIDPQALVNQYAGTGQAANKVPLGQPGSVERITTNQTIGIYYENGVAIGPTTNFTIRYGKDGVHIIPARP